jgi:NAD(P)-dependent dehydrogenase (short-subunit alcohol dehydrogenase family)
MLDGRRQGGDRHRGCQRGRTGIGAAAGAARWPDGIADRDARGAAAVRAELGAAGGTAIDCPVDVSVSTDVDRMIDRTVVTFGRIDVLVHCAGICPRQPVLEMSDEGWRAVMSVNLDGSFFVTRGVGGVMAGQRSGTMILLTSDRGLYGSADYAHYAASKGALIVLTKSLAIALGRSGVTVNGLNPGMTDTPRPWRATPSPRRAGGRRRPSTSWGRIAARRRSRRSCCSWRGPRAHS